MSSRAVSRRANNTDHVDVIATEDSTVDSDSSSDASSSSDCDSSYDATTDPSVPPEDGTCHFMRLPAELRLTIAELLLGDLFDVCKLGLLPLFVRPPPTQDFISLLQIDRTSRLEAVDLCTRLTEDSARVVDHTPTWPILQHKHRGPHGRIQGKHKKILRILRSVKLSTEGRHYRPRGKNDALSEDQILETRLQGRKRRPEWFAWRAELT
jgi:hypothetical protein